MFELSSTEAKAASPLTRKLRRICAGIAFVGAATIWLWALPTLLQRGGLGPRDGESCRQFVYRDPVTGRSLPAPGGRLAAPDACRVAAGDRP